MPPFPPLPRLPLFAFCLALAGPLCAQEAAPVPAPAVAAETVAAPAERQAPTLEPFLATYEALYQGKPAGSATMQLVRGDGPGRWRIDLTIHGERGIAGLARLNLQQSTVFDLHDGQYRPLTQATARKAMLFGKDVSGVYDWSTMQAHWQGDLKKERRRPLPPDLRRPVGAALTIGTPRNHFPLVGTARRHLGPGFRRGTNEVQI